MSRLSLLVNGMLFSVLVLNSSLVAYAQRGGAALSRSTVVASVAEEAVPVTQKKYIGNVEAIEQVDSVARVSGTLTVAPDFEEGSTVKKGQLLFEIDPIPYQAKVDSAKALIAQTEARIAYAESNYKRLNNLYEKNAGSQDDKESAFANLQSLKAELASAQASLVLAQEDLKYTKIYSELTGRAGRRAYSTGAYVSPSSDPLLTVAQMDPIYVRFTMSERDFLSLFGNSAKLKESSSLKLTLPNDEVYPHSGEISFIDNSVKSTTDTIKIWAKFSNPDETLNPGGVVTVNLTKVGAKTAASVLPSAVMFDGKTNYVYTLVDSLSDEDLYKEIAADTRFTKAIEAVESGEKSKEEFLTEFKQRYVSVDPKTGAKTCDFEDGKVNESYLMVLRRDVELGPSNGDKETILSGIMPGDMVVMDGVNKARPFDLIRPVYRNLNGESVAKDAPTAQEESSKTQNQTSKAAVSSPVKKSNLASLQVKKAGV